MFTHGAAALAATAGPAAAHIVLAPDTVAAGGYYAGVLRVTHGCGGSATTSLRVTIPAGVLNAKPQPKAGWTVSMEREPLPASVPTEGGGMQHDRVVAITWRGRLPDDEFDAFGLAIKAPQAPGPLVFPTVQTCEASETRWTDVPGPGQSRHSLAHPAPALSVEPAAAPMAGMAHP